MSNLFPRSVLITQGELINYAGSEIVTLELAEYFSAMGSTVHVLTNYIGAPVDREFQKLKNVVLHTSTAGIDFKRLGLIWIHHQLVPSEILELAGRGKLKAKVVFHHMSPYHPLEFPFAAKIEQYLADEILYNSHESKKAIEGKLAGFDLNGRVFNNPAPDYFYVAPDRKKYRKDLKHVLVVSNHVPDELQVATDSLKRQGIAVKVFGRTSQQEYRRVTPKDLAWADAVVSIGKTVQYAIRGGVPVYCYDHFGGCGYFTEKNFRKASRLNFSGRGFAKKDADTIVDELIKGYHDAQSYSRLLHQTVDSEYSLSDKVVSVLNNLRALKPRRDKALSAADTATFEAMSKHLWSVHGGLCDVRFANQELAQLSQQYSDKIAALEGELGALREQLVGILNSKSWKITSPLRQANAPFKRRDA